MKRSFIFIVTILIGCTSTAQFNPPWQGKKCAVVLTYDDAIDQHLDHAVPVLDSLQLKATFYLTAFAASIQKRLPEWRSLAVKEMLLSGGYATPVYELFSKKGYGTKAFPPVETRLAAGDIAWRQHSGGHTTVPNWPAFIKWVSRYLEN